MRDFMVAARTLLEGDPAESVAAAIGLWPRTSEIPKASSISRDISRIYSRSSPHSSFLNESSRAASSVFQPWTTTPLDPLRKKPAFTKSLRQAESRHLEAAAEFAKLQGEQVLGVARTA